MIDDQLDNATPDPRSLKRTRGGRERLLSVAAELFGRNGLAGTSLQMIADRLGVSKPAIYHHFRSRDDIVEALMSPVIADAAAGLERIEHLDDPSERADAARSFYADFVVTHRRVINMFFFDRAALTGDLAVTVDAMVDRVAAALMGRDARVELPLGMTLVYGTAALVVRSTDVDDPGLHANITHVLRVTTDAAARTNAPS
ncbi:TetR/AcrR family transcriptional regulator [Microbacterium sp. NPDC089189]|uniref:TetR/AcrR family transcriptional regulator n=1 Tax=Microbacterium sp. NPDC089189 TaxID=3154972 RepID=UPI003428BDF4